MKKATIRSLHLISAFVGLATLNVGAGNVGYTLDITTSYLGSQLSDLVNGGAAIPSPDTGFFQVANNGSTTFSGSVIIGALAGNGTDFSQTVSGITLAPGAHESFGINNESSNQGGYGVVAPGLPQAGVKIELSGTIHNGSSEPIDLTVFDKDIHSGVPRLANGTLSDSYVLQGGDPLGGDTGDGYELTQAPGHFEFFEAKAAGVPDAGTTLSLLGMGLTALIDFARRSSKQL